MQSEDASHVKELLEEYKDRFEGIGKLTGIQVDLNVDPEFKPIFEQISYTVFKSLYV